MRTRSLSPSANMEDGNKRPAIVCNFFAKGWCIRGSSCRFLHIKDCVNNTERLAEGDLATTNWKREVQLEEGILYNLYKPTCSRICSAKIFLIKIFSCNRS